ncbi:MAG: IS630 family transposase [Bacteroidota bacterium]
MARIPQPIFATEGDRQELLTMSRSHKLDSRYVLRSNIILYSLEGKSLDEIRELSGASRVIINKWRNRFRQSGVAGIKDAPRSGKPAIFTAADEARVIQKACQKPSGGYTNWSQRRIAADLGMSQAKVHQILKKAALKPHKVDYWCGKSPDPEFETKMLSIVGLYMNPPERAIVLCVDEKSQLQALDRTQPELPLRSGNARRQTATYKRNGTLSLIASLAVHKGEVIGKTISSNNKDNFLSFLKHLDRTYRNCALHIIVDNFSAHKHKDVKAWLEKKRKITVHYTPTYSSWLNQVEIWFNMLQRDVIKGGIWQSTKQMADQIMEYIKTYNESRAKPFQWTYSGQKN